MSEVATKKKLPSIAYGQLKYRDYFIYTGYGYSGHPLDFVHSEYDGAPDAHDHRLGQGDNVEDCMEQIDEQIRRD